MSFSGFSCFPALLSAGLVLFYPLAALSAAHFLPNYEDHLAAFQNTNLDFNANVSSPCKDFNLSACPLHAKCTRCAFDNKFYISSCFNGYKLNSDKSACLPKSCSEIDSSYIAAVPTEKNCARHLISDITCYSSCYSVSCSSYTLSSCPENASCISCPDCDLNSSRVGNCSAPKLKVASCISSTQKVNADASACIDKDDTCPSGYFKTCDSGIDPNYSSVFTELGSECFRCKARTCSSGAWNLDYYFCNGFLKCLIPAK